jgi:hypothetical protein
MSCDGDKPENVESNKILRRKNKIKEDYKIMFEDFNNNKSLWLQCYTSEETNTKCMKSTI